MRKLRKWKILLATSFCLMAFGARAAELAKGAVFSVVELPFIGPPQTPKDTPLRDIDFSVRFRHESGAEITVHGFWDGDGSGGMSGNVFKVRFCPTKIGKWTLADVPSNRKELVGQHAGDHIIATASTTPGFWEVDTESAGQRWYRRSNGTHPYIIGNTHYTFLSGYGPGGKPSGNDIVTDIRRNAEFFKKLRLSVQGDRYVNPVEKPFLDDDGKPTDEGDYSFRPNPRWFHQRVDLAVATAWQVDLIADLILCGPDTRESRSTLRAQHNGGDPTPYLKYIAARYGAFPNVWLCLSNEYDIKEPNYTQARIAAIGGVIRKFLPYPTPLSVHDGSRILWSAQFDRLPPWADHQIIQRKIRTIAPAADVLLSTWKGEGATPRNKPTIDDELSYQGDGDKHNEGDTVEAHLGAFLGGGYGSTGYKSGNKLGHYFWGKFDPAEHTAADKLKFLREVIDTNISFWRMSPDTSFMENPDSRFRGLAWKDNEYALGTDHEQIGLTANLPPGQWRVVRYDIMAKESKVLATDAAGRFTFDASASRAVLFHFKRN